ncbi:hypothetical protein U1Q18_051961, partial [Sarracenia purpurea var. burkii]
MLDEIKCRNVCHQYGWLFTVNEYKHRNRTETGLTKCCTPVEFFSQIGFSKFIPNPPADEKVYKKILAYGGKAIDLKAYQEAGTYAQLQLGQFNQADMESGTMIFDKNLPQRGETGQLPH